MTPNLPLLRKTMDFIKHHPEEWDQSDWFAAVPNTCGTAMCFAGHAAVFEGAETPAIGQSWWVYEETGAMVSREEFAKPGIPPGAEPVQDYAARALGLTPHVSALLFRGTNTMADLDAIVTALENGVDLEDAILDGAGGLTSIVRPAWTPRPVLPFL